MRAFSRVGLERLLADAGFARVRIEGCTPPLRPWQRPIGAALSRTLPFLWRAVASQGRSRWIADSRACLRASLDSRCGWHPGHNGALHRFGAFGEGSLFVPPYRLTCPQRMHIGARTVIGPYAFISVLGERLGERYDGVLRIGDDTSIGQNFIVSCAGSMVIGSNVLISSNVHIGDAAARL